MRSTIKDVAQLAGVSISTVSRVMNRSSSVHPDKVKRVLAAIEELHFEPNTFARGLINNRSNMLGVLIPDLLNPYYSGVIRGMEDAAKAFNYGIVICNTDRDEQRTLSYLHNFNHKHIDGVLFTSDVMRESYYKIISQHRVPTVLISTDSKYSLPSIRIDDEQAAFDAVKYLIKLGHRHIGFLGFTLPDPITGEKRLSGYRRALKEAGLLSQCESYHVYAKGWFEEGYRAATYLFADHPQITAVFTCSDEFAMATISYLHDQSRQVPKHVSVVGFDNVRMSWMTTPRLTTIAQPMYELGYQAVQILHNQLTSRQMDTTKYILPHELIVRDSTSRITSQNLQF